MGQVSRLTSRLLQRSIGTPELFSDPVELGQRNRRFYPDSDRINEVNRQLSTLFYYEHFTRLLYASKRFQSLAGLDGKSLAASVAQSRRTPDTTRLSQLCPLEWRGRCTKGCPESEENVILLGLRRPTVEVESKVTSK